MRTETRGAQIAESGPVDSLESPKISLAGQELTAVGLLSRYGVFVALAVTGSCWDLWSKWYIFDQLGCPGRQRVWTGSVAGLSVQFDLATTFNRGALWGIGQNQTWLFAGLSFVAIVVIGYFLWSKQAIASWWLTVATGLLFAGTLGNLYDRLSLHGWKDELGPVYAVRDFLDFVFCDGAFNWATFNFADVFLVTGAIMLVLQSFWGSHDEMSVKPSPAVPRT